MKSSETYPPSRRRPACLGENRRFAPMTATGWAPRLSVLKSIYDKLIYLFRLVCRSTWRLMTRSGVPFREFRHVRHVPHPSSPRPRFGVDANLQDKEFVELDGSKRKKWETRPVFHGFQANNRSIRAENRGKTGRLPAFCGRLAQVRQTPRRHPSRCRKVPD
jgi:hypothetical protein